MMGHHTLLLLNATETANLNGLIKTVSNEFNLLRIKGSQRQPSVGFFKKLLVFILVTRSLSILRQQSYASSYRFSTVSSFVGHFRTLKTKNMDTIIRQTVNEESRHSNVTSETQSEAEAASTRSSRNTFTS